MALSLPMVFYALHSHSTEIDPFQFLDNSCSCQISGSLSRENVKVIMFELGFDS